MRLRNVAINHHACSSNPMAKRGVWRDRELRGQIALSPELSQMMIEVFVTHSRPFARGHEAEETMRMNRTSFWSSLGKLPDRVEKTLLFRGKVSDRQSPSLCLSACSAEWALPLGSTSSPSFRTAGQAGFASVTCPLPPSPSMRSSAQASGQRPSRPIAFRLRAPARQSVSDFV